MRLTIVFIIISFLSLSLATRNFNWIRRTKEVLEEIKQSPTFDFIVVGSGSAGSTVAAEILDAVSTARLLLVEAGSWNMSNDIYDLKNAASWIGSEYDWNDFALPDAGVYNRKLNLPSGIGIGGSSAINWMNWLRGDKNDFNLWANLTGDESWNYTNMLPILKRIERYDDSQSFYRGDSGDIGVTKYFTESTLALNLQEKLSDNDLINNPDYNGKSTYGVSIGQLNAIKKGKKELRQDAFTTQLKKHLNKKNFYVLTSTMADRLVFAADKAVKHLVIQNNGESFAVKASKEIILCAGVLRTPSILQRSGIGKCSDLAAHGIPCVVDLPGVGQNMDYHLLTNIVWPIVKKPTENIIIYLYDDKINVNGFHLPKHLIESFHLIENPLATENFFVTSYFQLHVKTKGKISLASRNPLDYPIITLANFQDPQDMADHIEGINLVLKFGSRLQGSLLGPTTVPPPGKTMDQFIRENTGIAHQVGTCKMGRTSDPLAVVDSKFRVFGVKGLRIVDTSIIPVVPSANPNCPTIAVAAKCAQEIIKKYYK